MKYALLALALFLGLAAHPAAATDIDPPGSESEDHVPLSLSKRGAGDANVGGYGAGAGG